MSLPSRACCGGGGGGPGALQGHYDDVAALSEACGACALSLGATVLRSARSLHTRCSGGGAPARRPGGLCRARAGVQVPGRAAGHPRGRGERRHGGTLPHARPRVGLPPAARALHLLLRPQVRAHWRRDTADSIKRTAPRAAHRARAPGWHRVVGAGRAWSTPALAGCCCARPRCTRTWSSSWRTSAVSRRTSPSTSPGVPTPPPARTGRRPRTLPGGFTGCVRRLLVCVGRSAAGVVGQYYMLLRCAACSGPSRLVLLVVVSSRPVPHGGLLP